MATALASAVALAPPAFAQDGDRHALIRIYRARCETFSAEGVEGRLKSAIPSLVARISKGPSNPRMNEAERDVTRCSLPCVSPRRSGLGGSLGNSRRRRYGDAALLRGRMTSARPGHLSSFPFTPDIPAWVSFTQGWPNRNDAQRGAISAPRILDTLQRVSPECVHLALRNQRFSGPNLTIATV